MSNFTPGPWRVDNSAYEALQTENARLRARVAVLEAALNDAKTALHNDFEPDNQSRAWHRVCAALARATE